MSRREIAGENYVHSVQGTWSLAAYAETEESPSAGLHPTMSLQSPSKMNQNCDGTSIKRRSSRRHTLRARDSVTVPVPGFSRSDDEYLRASLHPSWQIEARLWSHKDSETYVDVESFTFRLPQFVYQGNTSASEAELIQSSMLRWFHVPMNNVSIYPDHCNAH
jgi:hypothetical protein